MRLVSTYSGAGGMDLGFAMAGFEPIWANDCDPFAVQTYNQLLRPWTREHVAVVGDVRLQALPPAGSAEVVIGGPPCQGFSVAGKMNPDDARSEHVFAFLDVVERVQPSVFVMENVKGLYANRRWDGVRHMLRRRSRALGYQSRMLLLTASDFGVPQSRERMFFIGLRKHLGWTDPEPTSSMAPPSVRDALATLPRAGEVGNDSLCHARITLARNPVLRRSPFAGMLFNGQGRPLRLDRPAPTMTASMGGNRTPIIDQARLEDAAVGCWVRRYHAHLCEGGAANWAVPDSLRRITVQEAAALQTFPLGANWAGPLSARYRQVGNAVPPLLAKTVAGAVRQALMSRA